MWTRVFKLRYAISPRTSLYPTTSDEFFARVDIRRELGGLPVDLGFIDGMHLFEYALRDFGNLERRCSPESVILFHDCYPPDAKAATREQGSGVWSSDVWKVVLCLKEARPDLQISTVPVPWVGLTIVRNLDPSSTTIQERYEELVDKFMLLDYETLDLDKNGSLNVVPNDWETIKGLLPPAPFRTALPEEFRMKSWKSEKPPRFRSRLMPLRHRSNYRSLPIAETSAGQGWSPDAEPREVRMPIPGALLDAGARLGCTPCV